MLNKPQYRHLHIHAVMLSLRFINEELQLKYRSSIYFLCGGKN